MPSDVVPIRQGGDIIYHRWPRSYGGWQAGSVIQCEGINCRWCARHWKIVKIWDHAASPAKTDS